MVAFFLIWRSLENKIAGFCLCKDYFAATPGSLELINKYLSTVQAIREFSISFNIMNSVNFYYLYFVAIKGYQSTYGWPTRCCTRAKRWRAHILPWKHLRFSPGKLFHPLFAHKSWCNLSSVCKKPKVKKHQPSNLLTYSLGRLYIFLYKGAEFGGGWGGDKVKEKLKSIIPPQSQTSGRGDEQEQQEAPVATQTTDHQWGRRERIW